MEIEFKTKNPKQLQAAKYWLDDETDQILYGGAKGGGKSFLGASLIFGDALIYPETHYFIARKELIDLRKFTIPTIHEVFKNWGLNIDDYAKFNGQDNVFNLTNGSKVYLIACSEVPSDPLYERFGSMQMTRGWEEEAGEIPEAAHANLWLSIGRWKNREYGLKKKELITANPKKGWMKREFIDPYKGDYLPPTKKFIPAFATDNAYLPEDYVNTLRNEKDKVRRQRLFEGNWDYDEDQTSLISFDALSDAFSNTITKDNNKYLVIDVARLGKDSTVFSFWDGLELYRIEQFEKQSTETTKQRAKDFAAAERIPFSNIMVDEDGIGGAIVDGLVGVRGFVANSTPIPTAAEIRTRESKIRSDFTPKTNFRNLKTQCAYKLAELINEHKIAFKVPEYRDKIVEELTALLKAKSVDEDHKLQIKPKDEVKEDLGRSPDIGDTILYRAWFELKKEATSENPNQSALLSIQLNKFATNKRNQAINSTK
jgi:phage terminase large subunit